MRQIIALSPVALLLSLQATAQQPTDFSGVWEMDPSRSASALQATPIGPVTLIINQQFTELSIETRRKEPGKRVLSSEVLTYKSRDGYAKATDFRHNAFYRHRKTTMLYSSGRRTGRVSYQLAHLIEIESRQTRMQAGQIAIAEIAQEVGFQPSGRVFLAHTFTLQPGAEKLLVNARLIEP